jgi:predicted aspartyl protease
MMSANKLAKMIIINRNIHNNYNRNLIKLNKINKTNIEIMKNQVNNIKTKLNNYDYYCHRVNMIDANLMIVAGVLLMIPYFIK